jgi:hypothetical protein
LDDENEEASGVFLGTKSPRLNLEYLVMVITILYIAIEFILYSAVDFHIRLIANGVKPL